MNMDPAYKYSIIRNSILGILNNVNNIFSTAHYAIQKDAEGYPLKHFEAKAAETEFYAILTEVMEEMKYDYPTRNLTEAIMDIMFQTWGKPRQHNVVDKPLKMKQIKSKEKYEKKAKKREIAMLNKPPSPPPKILPI